MSFELVIFIDLLFRLGRYERLFLKKKKTYWKFEKKKKRTILLVSKHFPFAFIRPSRESFNLYFSIHVKTCETKKKKKNAFKTFSFFLWPFFKIFFSLIISVSIMFYRLIRYTYTYIVLYRNKTARRTYPWCVCSLLVRIYTHAYIIYTYRYIVTRLIYNYNR